MAAVATLRNDLRENELSVICLPFGDWEDGLLRLPVQACKKAQRTLIKDQDPGFVFTQRAQPFYLLEPSDGRFF